VEEFYASSAFRDLIPVEGSREGLDALKSLGFQVVIVTAREEAQRELTEQWLSRWFGGDFSHANS
jgi:phosphoglycolate phosphatase-like HAD superfamily hydrolase